LHQLLLQKSKTNIGENLIRTIQRFLQAFLYMIPPPQGFTPEQSLGIVGSPYVPRINAPQMESLSGSNKEDMKFNNTGETMIENNTSKIMEFN